MSIFEPVPRLPVRGFLSHCGLFGVAEGSSNCPPHSPILPLLDARSPSEFRQGHIPGAVNLPLFSDEERAAVGTVYKQQGREQAVLRGLSFVGPGMEHTVRRALELAGPDKSLAIYCSRGGMRSGSLAWLFSLSGLRVHVLERGYKAFRKHVLEFLQGIAEGPYRLRVLGGRTGSGKTELLRLMAAGGAQVLDLEGLAGHRGSAFGALAGREQPSCEHFENLLATALAQCDSARPVWVEDESENLGTVNLPRSFFSLLRSSPLAVVECPAKRRLDRVLAEYGDIPPERMAHSIDRIRKRLGGLEYKRAHAALAAGDLSALAEILLAYYDRAYEKQLRSRAPFARIAADHPAGAAGRLLALDRSE